MKKADPALGWWEQNSKCAYQESLRDLDRALRDFARSRNGQRKGTVKAKLGLAERTYRCGECGLVLDRDVNAARNLLSLAASGAERRNAGRGTRKTAPRAARPAEPGTRHPARRQDRDRRPPRRLRHERHRALNRNGQGGQAWAVSATRAAAGSQSGGMNR